MSPAERTVALFADWCAATGREPFPLDEASIEAYFSQVPVGRATRRARENALRAAYEKAHRFFPVPRVTSLPSAVRAGDTWLDVTEAVRRCPVTTLHGIAGRRDALVLVLLDAGATRREVHNLTPADVYLPGWRVAGRFTLPLGEDPATCPRCVLARWLVLAAALPPHGWRGEAHEVVFTPPALGHACFDEVDQRWFRAAHLVPSIDRHGWTGYTPLSRRYISRIVARRMSTGAPVWANPITTAAAAEPDRSPEQPAPLPPTTWKRTDLKPVTDELDDLLDRLDREAGALSALISQMIEG